MSALSVTAIVPTGRAMTFEFTTPWLNPIVNNEKLRSYLNQTLGKYLFVSDIAVFGNIKLTLQVYQYGLSVQSWANYLDTYLDKYLWGETEFVKAYGGEPVSITTVASQVLKSTGDVVEGIGNTAQYMPVFVALGLAIAGFILSRRYA